MLGDVNLRAFPQTTAEEAATASSDHDVESLVLMYQLQAEQFKEDFELEREDHQRTKAQVQSLTIQWSSLHDELRQCRAKVRFGGVSYDNTFTTEAETLILTCKGFMKDVNP